MGIETATLLAYSAAAGAAISVVSAVQQGSQQKSAMARAAEQAAVDAEHATAMGVYQKQQADADASVQQSEAQLQARQIRDAGTRQRSAARAALASSGVTVGTGTAEVIDKEINTNSEQDALTSIYAGDNRAQQIRAGGQIAQDQGAYQGRNLSSMSADYRVRGDNAQTASYLNAGASALSGIGQAARAWNAKPVKAD